MAARSSGGGAGGGVEEAVRESSAPPFSVASALGAPVASDGSGGRGRGGRLSDVCLEMFERLVARGHMGAAAAASCARLKAAFARLDVRDHLDSGVDTGEVSAVQSDKCPELCFHKSYLGDSCSGYGLSTQIKSMPVSSDHTSSNMRIEGLKGGTTSCLSNMCMPNMDKSRAMNKYRNIPKNASYKFLDSLSDQRRQYSTLTADVPVSNTVTWCLDGTPEQVYEGYLEAIGHYRLWNILNGKTLDSSKIWGPGAIQYTTATSGTFYFTVTYGDDWLTNVIDGREGWNYGFYNKNGHFEYNHKYDKYIDHEHWKMLKFPGDYRSLAPQGHANMVIWLPGIRDSCVGMARYDGQSPDPPGMQKFCGVMIHFTCEGMKEYDVCDWNSKSLLSPVPMTLSGCDQKLSPLIKSWMKTGKATAHYNLIRLKYPDDIVTPKLPKIPGISTIKEAMDALCIIPYNSIPRPRPDDSNARNWKWTPLDPKISGAGGKAHPLSSFFGRR